MGRSTTLALAALVAVPTLACSEGPSAARAEYLESLGPVTYSEQEVRQIVGMGADASSELPDDRAEEVEAMFVAADVDAICDGLEDNGNGMESRNRSADTQRMKFVLMAGVVGRDLLDEVNEQCLVSLRWMLTAGASD